MKQADNFNASKWLVENKITTQSRLDENNNQKPDFSSDAKNNFPELVKKYGTQVVDALENSYENFIDMYSSPVKVNIKYRKSIENYKNNPKDLEDLIQMTVNEVHEAASTNEKQMVLKDLINVYKPELDELTYDALVRLKEYIEDILISDF